MDRTVQRAFMHIDSGSGQKPPALVGTKSVWCGTIVCSPTETCPWASPPGYGNNWNQVFQSTPFNVNGDVSVSYAVKYDLEASYDFAYLEYAGANNVWHTLHTFTGTGFTNPVNDIIPGANYTGPLRIRFRVQTDGSGSDEDGLYPSNGALQIDNLVAHAGPTTLCNETFESEVAGDLTT
ncbi:MAG TPA: hypothetical protein VJS69_05920, partial [Candidatus Krumholzibacteria bacterium]|nr:hypothetical protein [Candidatus Krumholzibacteria bacterium]